MKLLFLSWITIAVIVTVHPATVIAADDLSRAERARIESDLLRELAPSVGVFDYVAFQLDGKGAVTLTGQVRDATLKRHMSEDARKVDGIRRVNNRIEILPVSPTDDQIRQAVYNAIYRLNGFERYRLQATPPVHIIVKNGAVTLEGVVATSLEYAQVRAAANNVPGVFSVKSNVRVAAND
jgi:hyperosmotically inducible protein